MYNLLTSASEQYQLRASSAWLLHACNLNANKPLLLIFRSNCALLLLNITVLFARLFISGSENPSALPTVKVCVWLFELPSVFLWISFLCHWRNTWQTISCLPTYTQIQLKRVQGQDRKWSLYIYWKEILFNWNQIWVYPRSSLGNQESRSVRSSELFGLPWLSAEHKNTNSSTRFLVCWTVSRGSLYF